MLASRITLGSCRAWIFVVLWLPLLQGCGAKRNVFVPIVQDVPDVKLDLEKLELPELQLCQWGGAEMVCITKDGLDAINRNMLRHLSLLRQCKALQKYYGSGE